MRNCGYMVEYDNGTQYYPSETDNGFCYKYMPAFYSGEGVCYIPECMFDDGVYSIHEDDVEIYTREILMDLMSEYLSDCDVETIENRTEYVLQELDWQSPETLMEEIDWEEVVKEVYSEGCLVYFRGSECRLTRDMPIEEVYRKSDKVCPHCGGPLYHEKYKNTRDHYPYVCFECDENFFNIEV